MRYLNLTKDFNPCDIHHPEELVSFKAFQFPGGEPHIVIEPFHGEEDVHITIRVQTFYDIGLLIMAEEALQFMGCVGNLHLTIPYFPGARQDRRMVEGEPLSAKVYAKLINDMDFSSVTMFDVHSDVTPALVEVSDSINNHAFVYHALLEQGVWEEDPCEIQIVSPDAGANKKIKDLVKYLYHLQPEFDFKVIKCDKTRDVATGKISGFEIHSEIDSKAPLYIIDDICDGGGTFIGLGKELIKKSAGHLHLIVSHGIFSRGTADLFSIFKTITTTDSFIYHNVPDPQSLTRIPLSKVL